MSSAPPSSRSAKGGSAGARGNANEGRPKKRHRDDAPPSERAAGAATGPPIPEGAPAAVSGPQLQPSAQGAPEAEPERPSEAKLPTKKTAKTRGRAVDPKLWARDPIYRIVRGLPRSDVVHFVKCKLREQDCVRAARYIEDGVSARAAQLPSGAGSGGILELRLQWMAPLAGHLSHMLPLLAANRFSLRKLDLSRNRLGPLDIPQLAAALQLEGPPSSHLEVLDFSFNPIGNEGAALLLAAIAPNRTLKALLMKHCDIDDGGCAVLATHLHCRPVPRLLDGTTAEATFGGQQAVAASPMFFMNLNGNRVGSAGMRTLTRAPLPSHVSLTASRQCCVRKTKSAATAVHDEEKTNNMQHHAPGPDGGTPRTKSVHLSDGDTPSCPPTPPMQNHSQKAAL